MNTTNDEYINFETNISNSKNPYFLTVMKPFSCARFIPDLNMSTSFLKTISLTHNLKVRGNGEFLLLHLPNQPRVDQLLRLYVPDITNFNQYTYVGSLVPDEDLSENYSIGRIVSGGLEVYSNTISTTNVALAGSLNAVDYQEKPAFNATFNFDRITSFKRNALDVQPQLPTWNGVVSLMHPSGNLDFRRLETTGTYNTANILEYQETKQFNVTPANWNFPHSAIIPMVVYRAGIELPYDLWGRIKILFNLQTNVAILGLSTMTMRITSNRISEADWVTRIDETTDIPMCLEGCHANTQIIVDLTAELTKIEIFDTAGLSSNSLYANFILTASNYYEEGFRGPGTIIGIQGMQPDLPPLTGAVLNLSGKYNYEVVPDASLSRQIPTGGPHLPENPFYIEAAEYAINSGETKFLWKRSEYEFKCASGDFERAADQGKLLKAAGFGDVISGLARFITPVASGLATAFGGPMVGNAVRAIGNSISGNRSAGSYRNTAMLNESAGSYRRPKTLYEYESAGHGYDSTSLLGLEEQEETQYEPTPLSEEEVGDYEVLPIPIEQLDLFDDYMDIVEFESCEPWISNENNYFAAGKGSLGKLLHDSKLRISDATPTLSADLVAEYESETNWWKTRAMTGLNMTIPRGLLYSAPFDYIVNAFMVVDGTGEGHVCKLVYSPIPVSATYTKYTAHWNNEPTDFYFYSDRDVDEIFLAAIASAVVASRNYVDKPFYFLLDCGADIKGTISGPSVGAAAAACLMKISGPYICTGIVLPNGDVECPASLQSKLLASSRYQIPLIFLGAQKDLIDEINGLDKSLIPADWILPIPYVTVGVYDFLGTKPFLIPTITLGTFFNACRVMSVDTEKGKPIPCGTKYAPIVYTKVEDKGVVSYAPKKTTPKAATSIKSRILAVYQDFGPDWKLFEGTVIPQAKAGRIRANLEKGIVTADLIPIFKNIDNTYQIREQNVKDGWELKGHPLTEKDVEGLMDKYKSYYTTFYNTLSESSKRKFKLQKDYSKFLNGLESTILNAVKKKTKTVKKPPTFRGAKGRYGYAPEEEEEEEEEEVESGEEEIKSELEYEPEEVESEEEELELPEEEEEEELPPPKRLIKAQVVPPVKSTTTSSKTDDSTAQILAAISGVNNKVSELAAVVEGHGKDIKRLEKGKVQPEKQKSKAPVKGGAKQKPQTKGKGVHAPSGKTGGAKPPWLTE